MVRRVAVMYVLFMTCTPVFAGPKEDALAAYHRFFELFTTDNHDQVAALFAPDALFYGTGSPEVVTTPEGIRQYFVGALTGKRGTVKATPFAQTALVLSDSIAKISQSLKLLIELGSLPFEGFQGFWHGFLLFPEC
jgi:SnoaL-like domain